jgi:hypothetical protein
MVIPFKAAASTAQLASLSIWRHREIPSDAGSGAAFELR